MIYGSLKSFNREKHDISISRSSLIWVHGLLQPQDKRDERKWHQASKEGKLWKQWAGSGAVEGYWSCNLRLSWQETHPALLSCFVHVLHSDRRPLLSRPALLQREGYSAMVLPRCHLLHSAKVLLPTILFQYLYSGLLCYSPILSLLGQLCYPPYSEYSATTYSFSTALLQRDGYSATS